MTLKVLAFCFLICIFCLGIALIPGRRISLNPTKHHAFTRRKTSLTSTSARPRQHCKPAWVRTEVLRLLAITRGHVGCRTIAALFNQRFAFRGESVSKTYVAELRKTSRYEITQLRRKMRQPPKPCRPNQAWALDWTQLSIGGQTYTLLGVIDHGSRKLLTLRFADKSAKTVLTVLNRLSKRFGKPKSLRTDNDGALVSIYFALAMQRLGIRHQRTPPHSPWCNGRIERFFGTFKRAIRQIQIESKAHLQQAIDEFSFFYNHIRLHQNLNYKTPEMAWRGKTQFPIGVKPRWFAAWDGVLCGWYWGELKTSDD